MTAIPEQRTATAATYQPADADGSELVSRYRRDGYLVLPDALRSDEVRALREEAGRICRGERGAVDGAQPGADEPDELIGRRYLCIHFPHKLSELMRGMLAHPVVGGGPNGRPPGSTSTCGR